MIHTRELIHKGSIVEPLGISAGDALLAGMFADSGQEAVDGAAWSCPCAASAMEQIDHRRHFWYLQA